LVFKSYLLLHEFNVEAEMIGQLHAAGFAHAPGLFGSLNFIHRTDTQTLILVEEFVDNDGDGGKPFWDHLQQVLAGEAPPPISSIGFLAQIVGETTREFHAALIDPTQPAFQEEDPTPEDVAAWVAEFTGKFESATDLCHVRLPKLFPTVPSTTLTQAMGIVEGLGGAIRGSPLFQLDTVPKKQRLHGDLHLGQFLFQESREPPAFVITDLEGDPQVPPARRRDKKSVWFDLCGLLRALDYIAFFGTLEVLKQVDPERGWAVEDVFLAFFASLMYSPLPTYLEDLRDTWSPIIQRARAWVNFVSQEILEGYGIPDMRPRDPPAAAFKLIRATSELNYELKFRGQNALVPLLGVILAGNDWVQNI
jgi:predicted trehalose synthase